jgi:hypothetical protein
MGDILFMKGTYIEDPTEQLRILVNAVMDIRSFCHDANELFGCGFDPGTHPLGYQRAETAPNKKGQMPIKAIFCSTCVKRPFLTTVSENGDVLLKSQSDHDNSKSVAKIEEISI